MSGDEGFYHIKDKWSVGGLGYTLHIDGDESKIDMGKGHINKVSDLELEVKKGKIISISEDYKYERISKEKFEILKRKSEKYKKSI